jgi:hypothetical protein
MFRTLLPLSKYFIITTLFSTAVVRFFSLPQLREELRLRVFENRVLRRIFGPKRDEVTE